MHYGNKNMRSAFDRIWYFAGRRICHRGLPRKLEFETIKHPKRDKDVWGEYIGFLDLLYAEMAESIRLNNQLWYSSIDEELSEKNIDFIKRYLVARKAQLDELCGLD